MGENTKVQMTKERIRQALVVLLRTESLQKITVKELCEAAGVNRSTFYNHYGSPHDVLRDLSKQFLDDSEATLRSASLTDLDANYKRVEMVLHHAEENIEVMRILVNNEYDAEFPEKLFSLPRITELMENRVKEMGEEVKQGIPTFVIYGAYKLLQDWINQEERISPEEETRLLLGIAERVFRPDAKIEEGESTP